MTTDTITVSSGEMTLEKVRDQIRAFASLKDGPHYVEMNSLLMDEWWQVIENHLSLLESHDAVPNEDSGCDIAHKHHIFIYEVDFGDEGKGRYVRLRDFNKVCESFESILSRATLRHVSDEDVERAIDVYDSSWSSTDRGHENKMIAMRVALESLPHHAAKVPDASLKLIRRVLRWHQGMSAAYEDTQGTRDFHKRCFTDLQTAIDCMLAAAPECKEGG